MPPAFAVRLEKVASDSSPACTPCRTCQQAANKQKDDAKNASCGEKQPPPAGFRVLAGQVWFWAATATVQESEGRSDPALV